METTQRHIAGRRPRRAPPRSTPTAKPLSERDQHEDRNQMHDQRQRRLPEPMTRSKTSRANRLRKTINAMDRTRGDQNNTFFERSTYRLLSRCYCRSLRSQTVEKNRSPDHSEAAVSAVPHRSGEPPCQRLRDRSGRHRERTLSTSSGACFTAESGVFVHCSVWDLRVFSSKWPVRLAPRLVTGSLT